MNRKGSWQHGRKSAAHAFEDIPAVDFTSVSGTMPLCADLFAVCR